MTGDISLYMFIGVVVAITVTALAVTGIVTVMAVFSFRKSKSPRD